MILGQLIALGQLSDPKVNIVSVHALTPATVHINFLLPGATSRGGLPVVQHCVTCLVKVTFLSVNRMQSFLRTRVALHMLIINVWNKFSNKKFQKAQEIGKCV